MAALRSNPNPPQAATIKSCDNSPQAYPAAIRAPLAARLRFAFNVTGGELGLFPNALQRWHNQFQIRNVPDSGCTLFLALVAVVLLFSFDAAMRRCRSM